MNTDRKLIENRIFQLISYIKQDSLLLPLKQNISMFSLRELLDIQNFLETWKLNIIYNLLDKKYKEYLGIIEELKNIRIKNSMNKQKNIEEKEREKEELNLELLIEF